MFTYFTQNHLKSLIKPQTLAKILATLGAVCILTACQQNHVVDKNLSANQVEKLIPQGVKNASSWAKDITDIMQTLNIERSKDNVCSVIAIIEQESTFVADPIVAGLGEKSLKEINQRLDDKLGKKVADIFRKVLKNKPNVEDNFLNRIKKVKTERELDELYREIFSYFAKEYHVGALTGAAKIIGNDISERLNPITTLGSMQVHIDYAKANKRGMISNEDLRRDLYSQYGGLYYGIHRLMTYQADYDKPLYRFADYNSGMYSSRNASFQKMLASLTGDKISLDGDLLIYAKDGDPKLAKSQSEQAVIKLFQKHNIAMTERQIRFDLKREKEQNFENTNTYKTVVRLYGEKTGKYPPYAIMPEVVITGPKLSRDYNTNWFATRVDGRYQRCMAKAKTLSAS
ncbi:DUF1615 domain-containing protein [Moraxella sp. ZY210820]|uniref:DUF1615 domain-containing protein n=1 Tax=unclassified Moraxella TaxID=2685852 RepID=UPI002730ADAD|nr:DUF1615 domain-containing protein [Moraxella sp. ZY210820]WLF82890.1 DUF1615 domain-containing protein [Moraxella sp. ZY210820]